MIRGKKVPAILVLAAVFGCHQNGGNSSSRSTAPGSTQSPVTTGTVTPPPSSLPPSSIQPVSARPHQAPAPVTSAVVPPTPPAPPAAPIPGFAFDIDAPTWSNGPVYIACDLPVAGNAWSANAFQLKQDPVVPNRWTGLLQITSGTTAITSGTVINFKVTRGAWGNVEKGPEGEEVQNRVATCGPGPTKVYAHVFHWADDQILPPIVADRDLGIWFPRALTGLQRQIYAHLPPGYDDP
ncbi:MAG TPA: hypothetical protein VFF73_05355, partial [Planctomycetota bacterium]|nr:hypothetical protein [Planctomycetota bacterium]